MLDFGEDESNSGLLDGLDPADCAKMPVKPANMSIKANRQLDAIVELNYEASSDGEELEV